MEKTAWYRKSPEETLADLKTTSEGLSAQEVEERLKKYGPNKLPESKPDSLFIIFLRQFQSSLIYILMIAAVIVFLLKEWVDGFIILFVLLFNATAGTIQAGKAQNTLLALRKFTQTNAVVIRDGKEVILPDHMIVPGDIVILQEGEKVPADARVINSHNITADESAFTGESVPTEKLPAVLDKENLQPAEQKNMVFKGTHIVAGNGKAVVVSTGLNTVIGEISKKISDIKTEIPLQKNVRYLSHLIILVVSILSIAIFALGFYEGKPLEEIFLLAVAVMVSAIPEGLPVVMTLLLATGVWRMSKRNVLIKKLQAVEALGQAKVIAVDKTGTLTKSQLVVQKLYLDEGEEYSISGIGYDTAGEILYNNKKINPQEHPLVKRAGVIAGLCSNAQIFKKDGSWKISGDPTEAALTILSTKIGFSENELEDNFPQIAEIPFDYKLKYHTVLNKIDNENYISVTGAPEILLSLCDKIATKNGEKSLSQEQREEILDIFSKMSGEALRVLAFAQKKESGNTLNKEMVNGLTFIGLCGMKDALREEVPEAMAKTRDAGVKVVMITGDHKITAQAIAKEAGIWKEGDKILTNEDLEKMSQEELARELPNVSVFARITPEHKLKIVEGYRLLGQVVAMTGDGVNDALSLVAADLGVAMGEGGTEVAKEASDLVLLDDNFGSIVSAIEEGRSIYKNIKKVILYLFATSLGEIMVILFALFLNLPLPVIAAQLIWINLITDGFLVIPLALEAKEKDILKEKFVKPKKWFVDSWMAQRMFLMSGVMSVGSFMLFYHYFETDMIKATTMTVTALAVFQWFNVWNCRSEFRSVFQINPFSNKLLWAATIIVVALQLFAMHNPFMQNILNLTPLSFVEWMIIISFALSIIFVDELRKFIYQSFEKKRELKRDLAKAQTRYA